MKMLAALSALSLVLSALSGCKLGGPERTGSTCKVEARDADSIRIKCYSKDNGDVFSVQEAPASPGAWPRCQINQPWPACKEG